MPLVTTGRDAAVLGLIGALTTPFNNANAHLGVGDSTLATTAAMTDLQGASKARKVMDATFPTNPPSPANRITARSTFGTADANFAWNEVSLFNAATVGTMASRVVVALGTKTNASTFVLTYTLDITI